MGLKISSPGTVPSLPSGPLYEKLKKWSWQEINELQNSYTDNIYGFGLEREIVMKITKLTEIEVEELFYLLDCSDSEIINAITMFITFYLLGNCESFQLVVEKIYDLLDFYHSDALDRNELTVLMFCIARALSSILSQPNTCPTDTAMNSLVGKLCDLSGKKGKLFLTREEFSDILTLMVNKIHPKTLEAIYTNYFQSVDDIFPETDAEDVSLPSMPRPNPQHQQTLLVEPFEPSSVPDQRSEDQSNVVLSMLETEDLPDHDIQDDEKSVASKDSIKSNRSASSDQKTINSITNPVPVTVSSRPSSASSLREKQLAVLPPIPSSSQSPRREPIVPNQSPRSVDSVVKPVESGTSPQIIGEEGTVQEATIEEKSLSPQHKDGESLDLTTETIKDSARSLASAQSQPASSFQVEPPSISIVQFFQKVSSQPEEGMNYEIGFIEFSQISVSKLLHPVRSDVYPFVEIKLIPADQPSEVKWSHRTELSLDSEDDALWYTHFRSPYSSTDCQRNILRIDVYFMEKVSPRLSSVDDAVITEKKLHVGGAIITDSRTIFKKQMKWTQLIGILSSSENTHSPTGMYTITTRFNPNIESTPRSQFSHTVKEKILATENSSIHSQDQGPAPESGPHDGTAEGWHGEYEYDSYYHEGGYYDHYTHAYLGNAYDHATGQYYHDENIVYDPNQEYHDPSTSDQAPTTENASELNHSTNENDMRDVSPEDLYMPTAVPNSHPSPPEENGNDDESYSLDLELNPPNITMPTKLQEPVPSEENSYNPKQAAPVPQPSAQAESTAGTQSQREQLGFFEVQQVTISKLKKTDGFFSSSRIDPFVTLSLSDPSLWSHSTDVQTDKAAAVAEWMINSSIHIPINTLMNQEMSILVKDQKAKNKIIGRSSISLLALSSKGSDWSLFEGTLKENDKVCGEYSVRMRYYYKASPSK